MDLSGNRLGNGTPPTSPWYWQPGFGGLAYVDWLDLSDNGYDDAVFYMDTIYTGSYTAHWILTTVGICILDDNRLTTLQPFHTSDSYYFTYSVSLRVLSVRHNGLQSVGYAFLHTLSMSTMTSLDLTGNQLTSLTFGDLFLDTSLLYEMPFPLEYLGLADNKWTCDCNLMWLRQNPTVLDSLDSVDPGTCLTPRDTAGQYIVCYPEPNNCGINIYDPAVPAASYTESDDICDTYILPNDTSVPIVTNVWPLYGPVAGGTRVTISGERLNWSEPIVALFPVNNASASVDVITLSIPADNGNHDDVTSPKYDELTVITSPVYESRSNLAIDVIYKGGPTINTGRYFEFRPNPNITDISPISHLIVGGTLVTMYGRNMDSAAVPTISVTVVVRRLNSSLATAETERMNRGHRSKRDSLPYSVDRRVLTEYCTSVESSRAICRMPPVSLPSDFVDHSSNGTPVVHAGHGVGSVTSSNGHDRASVYIGAQFDGFRDYDNFTESLPDTIISYYNDPIINPLGAVLKFDPEKQKIIDIKGEHLQVASKLENYVIRIGSGQCNGTRLTDNALSCTPPYDEPDYNETLNALCKDLRINQLDVRVAYSRSYFYACVEYVDDDNSKRNALIAGLTVGLGVPLIVGLIVLAICLVRRRRRDQNDGGQRKLTDTQ
jgi:hypothetical protein